MKEYLFKYARINSSWCKHLVQQTQTHPLDYAKSRLIDSSQKLYRYQLWLVLSGIAFVILIIIAFFVFLVPLGFDLATFDPTNISSLEDMIFGVGTGLLVFLALLGIMFVIVLIMTYIQYYRLGTGFSLLYKADPISNNARNAGYGLIGYVMALILGIVVGFFTVGYIGTIISIMGTISLALGFYFINRTFVDYQKQERFPKAPSYLLLTAGVLSVASTIVQIFTVFGSLISILIPILLVFGFRELTTDLTLIRAPLAQPGARRSVSTQATYEPHPARPAPSTPVPSAPETSSSTDVLFCSSCGAKAQSGAKFCENCGANI